MWHCTVYLATYYIVAWNKVLLCITLTLWIFSSGLKRSLIGGFSEGVQEIVYDFFFFFFFWQNMRFMIKLFITPIET